MAPARVLLDTGVVIRIFMKNGVKDFEKLMGGFALDAKSDLRYVVPTPVCYELGKWNPDWHRLIYEVGLDITNYANYNISGKILKRAAAYIVGSLKQERSGTADMTGTKEKISMVDSLIAAYSLEQNLLVLTLNQVDFVPKYFDLVSVRAVNQGVDRIMIYLLRPKLVEIYNEQTIDS